MVVRHDSVCRLMQLCHEELYNGKSFAVVKTAYLSRLELLSANELLRKKTAQVLAATILR